MAAPVTGLSVLTIVRNRTDHLLNLVEGLRRSNQAPDELVIVDMSDKPIDQIDAAFPIVMDHFDVGGLPLAAARNRAAGQARSDKLVFLDVDCIPLADCLGRLETALNEHDALICADIRYLGPGVACAPWSESDLRQLGYGHPVREFPIEGLRSEPNPGLFWSLGFALRADTFGAIGGFDEGFEGYGGEDTDFGFRAAECDIPLLFAGGALACHQYHESYDPPVNHLSDIVTNARRFYSKWDQWPMEGWLSAFADMGLVRWEASRLEVVRPPTESELKEARIVWPEGLVTPKADRTGGQTVLLA